MSLLQWGLTLSSEETSLPRSVRLVHARASMGPHSFERGNDQPSRSQISGLRASMGPHSFERGNRHSRRLGKIQSRGFNGASLFRARKLAYQQLRRDTTPYASMGPHSFERGKRVMNASSVSTVVPLQWGLTLSSEETSRLRRQRAWHKASMGPHSFERGNPQAATRWHDCGLGFNGASLFRARKLERAALEVFNEELQWGLTLSSEETRYAPS